MTVATTVPLLDLKAQHETMRDEIASAIAEVVDSQWFIMGPNVSAFEEEIAEYVGVKHAIGCGSGSDALLLALMVLPFWIFLNLILIVTFVGKKFP